MISGFIVLIATCLMVCKNAFSESFLWGIGSFIPFVWWRYARKNWEQNKKVVWTNVGATAVIFGGFGIMGESSMGWNQGSGFHLGDSEPGIRSDLTADQTVRTVLDGMAEGDIGVLWDAMPPSYQDDLNTLIHDYANAVDPNVWNRSTALVRRLTTILQTKKEFICNTPMLKEIPNKAAITQQYDQGIQLMKVGLNSDLSNLDKLKTIDLGDYLKGAGSRILKMAITAADAGNNDPSAVSIQDLSKTQITTVRSDDRTATLEVTFPGQEKEPSEWVKVENRWVPKVVADEWPQMMQESRQAIATMKQEPQMSAMQANMMFGMVEGMLGPFENAQTQEEFDRALGSPFGMMMPGMEGNFADSRGFAPQVEDRVLQSQRKRALAGQRTAQYDLGMRYFHGDGVEQSDDEARHWLTESANQGYSRAKKALAELEERLQAERESQARIESTVTRLSEEN